MLSVSYAGKNVHSAGKTGALLRGDASGANRCYVDPIWGPWAILRSFLDLFSNFKLLDQFWVYQGTVTSVTDKK